MNTTTQHTGHQVPLRIEVGTCYALFAYDIGLSIDLAEADLHIPATKERGKIRHKRRAPDYFEYHPAPLKIVEEGSPIEFGAHASSESVEITLYDFGAVSVVYRIPIAGDFSALLELSQHLYENRRLLADSRERAARLLAGMQRSVERPSLSEFSEDYVIFHIEKHTGRDPTGITVTHTQEMAQILRCESEPLSRQEIGDALSSQISYGPEDVVVVDWNAALLLGEELDDARAVLEFANVELLEMRFLDQHLNNALHQAYEALSKKMWRRLRLPGTIVRDVPRIAQLQVDNALIFERVTNTLKLFGDQYLARVYRSASQRFHLESWDSSIMRKLQTLDSIYEKITDRAANRRLELLEWIIIILIALSIVLPFLPSS